MPSGNELFTLLDQLNRKEKKSKQDLDALDDAVREVLGNQNLTGHLLSELESGTKWNPSTLAAFSKLVVSKCNAEGLDEIKKQTLLLLLRSNYRGKWPTDRCRALSLLLREGVPEALPLLNSIITKSRAAKDREIWDFYDSHFSSLFFPMGGLPYLLLLALEVWPESPNQQLEIVLTRLVKKHNAMPPVRALMKQAEEAFGTYLEKRSLDESRPFDSYEAPLLELIRKCSIPAWEGYLRIIDGHMPDTTETERAVEPARDARQTIDEVGSATRQGPEKETPQPRPRSEKAKPGLHEAFDESVTPFEREILGPLEKSGQEFLRNLSILTAEYKKLKEEYSRKTRALEKREEKLFELTESHLVLERKISELKQQIKKADLLLHETEEENNRLKQKCEETEKRSDERVHQIRLQAKNELLGFKHNLWMRLRPDLDDLMREGIGEENYATPDRGRSLFRRFQDVIRSLSIFEVIPKKQ